VPFNLVVFCLLNYTLTVLSLTLTIPAGVPYCVFGAAFGRLFGIIVQYIFPSLVINEGVYAIIGSAAFISSVTRTLSIAIIVFEMNQQLTHMIPVLLSVLVSYAVS
jgi:H+/Cl- antiporter ClcA